MSGLPDLPDEGDVKKRQQILIGGVIVVLLLVAGYVYLTNAEKELASANWQIPVEIDLTSPGQTNDPIQNWVLQNENKLSAYEAQQQQQKKEIDERIDALMKKIETLSQNNSELEKRVKGQASMPAKLPMIPLPPRSSLPINKPEVLAIPVNNEKPDAVASPNKNDGSQMNTLADRVLLKTDNQSRIVKIKFKSKGSKRNHIRNTIPAGSFGQAVLLSGLDAPTGGLAERNPHPILLELIGNGNLPNRYRHRVKQCRVVASGTGNISDERAYLRLERLTCILKNGEIISEVITGTVTGEDGKNGMRGNLVTKQGQIIANAFLAGSLSNIGSAVAQSYTTVATSATGTIATLDPDKVLQSGAASGIGSTMEKIADWYFKRAEETYPIIEISAGRIVNLFLTEDVPLGTNLLSNFTPESAHE
jgi:conjugal transfer pilus assembly protein TraB